MAHGEVEPEPCLDGVAGPQLSVVTSDASVHGDAESPTAGALEFLSRFDEQRWLVSWRGRSALARRLATRYAGSPVDQARLQEYAETAVGLSSPRLVPVLGLVAADDAWWLIEERAGGVELPRLRALCELNPREAAVVARGALAAVVELHSLGWWHGRLEARDVVVDRDGHVRLQRWAPGVLLAISPPGTARVADVLAVRDLAVGLLCAIRPRSGWTVQARDEAVCALEEAGRPEPGADVGPAADRMDCRLADLVGPPERAERTRGELAALVRSLPAPAPLPAQGQRARTRRGRRRPTVTRGHAVPVGDMIRQPSPPAAADAMFVPARRSWAGAGEPAGERGAWVWKSLVALTVLVLVVGVELGTLGGKIARDLRVLRAPGAPSPAAASHTAALPSLGLASAGPVVGVSARPLRPCAPGRPCALSVVVRVRPQSAPLSVRWNVVTVDLCTARRVSLPGGTVTVPARAVSGAALRTVDLPKGRALAVGAVITAPVRVASAAVPAPSPPGTC